jgi:dihydroxy-acid dehydratase
LIENGDRIEIDIPQRRINLIITDEELENRKRMQQLRGVMAYKPEKRIRFISNALKAYANFVASADKGAVRIIE